MEHPNADLVRRFLTAWFRGDAGSWRELAAPDVVTRMPAHPAGSAPVSVEVDDVVADERFAVAIVRAVYQVDGAQLQVAYACAHKLGPDGKVTEAWHVSDQQGVECLLVGSEAVVADEAEGEG